MKYWIILIIAIVFEVLSAMASKQSATGNHFFTGVFIFSLITSHGLLWYALKGIDLSMAYPIWTGVALMLITLSGMIAFKEPFTLMKIGFVLCIAVGVVGLELSSVASNDHPQTSRIEHS